jgi:UDP:flavonoid glycosyltransferase YjiC (YdhE family)
MPYGHDQPDNAARCRRIGVAEIVGRKKYTAETSAAAIHKLLSLPGYSASAAGYAGIVQSEKGAAAAADAIEHLLNK